MRKTAHFLGKGFTMIELLIVIAVLGVLAVAVLSAINPIEQINRGKDTGSRSDAEQLISAIDRFYTAQGYYPWKTGPAGSDVQLWLQIGPGITWLDSATPPVSVLLKLSTGGTSELKSSFTGRIVSAQYNYLAVYNRGTAGDSTYVCFNGLSGAFQQEAKDRCLGTKGAIPSDIDPGVRVANICGDGNGGVVIGTKTGQFLTCLP